MMQEIGIVAIVFGSVLAALKLILGYASSRRGSSREATTDRSMTTGELTGLIDEAVQTSTAELRRRVENLEAIVTEEVAPGDRRLLDVPDPADFDSVETPERQRAKA